MLYTRHKHDISILAKFTATFFGVCVYMSTTAIFSKILDLNTKKPVYSVKQVSKQN